MYLPDAGWAIPYPNPLIREVIRVIEQTKAYEKTKLSLVGKIFLNEGITRHIMKGMLSTEEYAIDLISPILCM